MVKKPKVEVDEGLVRQVIAGQLPLTTKVTREIEDPAQQEPGAEPDVAARDSEEAQDIPTPAPEPRRRRTMVIPDFEQKRIEGNVSFRGRIRMITLICIAWRIIKNKDGRKLLHEWEKWKEEK